MTDESIDKIELIVYEGGIVLKDSSYIDDVYENLKEWNDIKVFKKEDMPEYFRVKNAKHALDIQWIMPRYNNVTLGLDNNYTHLYMPPYTGDDSEEAQSKGGNHGFEDITADYETEGDFPDMRSIFMAIGPAFKSNYQNKWIKLVDEYQVGQYFLFLID